MQGIGFVIFPTSWAFGPWNMPHKWLFAIGPFRLVYHKRVDGRYGQTYDRSSWRDPD